VSTSNGGYDQNPLFYNKNINEKEFLSLLDPIIFYSQENFIFIFDEKKQKNIDKYILLAKDLAYHIIISNINEEKYFPAIYNTYNKDSKFMELYNNDSYCYGKVINGKLFSGEVKNYKLNGATFNGKFYDSEIFNGHVINYSVGGGTFTGEIKNKIMWKGKAENIQYNINNNLGTFSGEISNGIFWSGIADNISYSKAKNSNKTVFCGIYKYGMEYDGYIYETIKNSDPALNDIIIKTKIQEGSFSNEIPKLQRADSQTYFQKLIDTNPKNTDIKKKILIGDKNTFKNLSLEEKFDINNDSSRRFFETVFAKKLLNYTINHKITNNSIHQEKIKYRIKNLEEFTHFLLNLSEIVIHKQHFNEWKNAKNDNPPNKNSTLKQYSAKKKSLDSSLENIIESKYHDEEVFEKQKKIIADVYDLHYLQYSSDKEGTDKGIKSKIYEDELGIDSNLYNSNPLYVKRGRLDNGFFRRIECKHQGILRSIDPTPRNLVDLKMDSNLKKYDGVTNKDFNDSNVRCPDRFEMDFPNKGNNSDKDSWLTSNFAKQVHPVVNGMSGSILCQIRFLVYCKNFCDKYRIDRKFPKNSDEYIKNIKFIHFIKNYKKTYNRGIPSFRFSQVRDYLRIVTGLFVFYEGGHTLNEIMSPFDLDIVKKRLTQTFPNHSEIIDGRQKNVSLNFENILFKDNLEVLDSSIIETEFYYKQIKLRNKLHNDILLNRTILKK